MFLRFVTKLLEDLVFFVVDIPNSGQDVLEIMVNKPNRERQKLMREQNILKQVRLSMFVWIIYAYTDDYALFYSIADFQTTPSPIHRQRRRTNAEVGGARRPAPRSFQAHLQALL